MTTPPLLIDYRDHHGRQRTARLIRIIARGRAKGSAIVETIGPRAQTRRIAARAIARPPYPERHAAQEERRPTD